MSALLEAEGVAKTFRLPGGWLTGARRVFAVRGVDLAVRPGETLALVGESGCGKSTLGQLMLALAAADTGRVRYKGEPVPAPDTEAWRHLRRELQLVFQDSAGALDPRQPVGRQIQEPLDIHGIDDDGGRRRRVAELLEAVGLRPDQAQRYPHELSGGQLQRVVIARALALEPSVLVLDEPVAALDVSIRGQIVNLLVDLQRRFHLAYLFISHDLGLVRHIADRVAVMYLGHIVEEGPAARLFANPRHPYTRALLAALPVPDPDAPREAPVVLGDPPSPLSPPAGCGFHPRCPFADGRCSAETPTPRRLEEAHRVACHHAERLP